MIKKLTDGTLNIVGGTYTASDFSIVDYSISMNDDEKFFHQLLENAAETASSTSQEITKTIQCTIKITVREECSMPPIWVLLPDVRKIGCGGYWHYEGHGYHSSCPVCGIEDHGYVNRDKISEAKKNFDRNKFPERKLSHA